MDSAGTKPKSSLVVHALTISIDISSRVFWLSIKHRHAYGKQTRVSQNLFVCRKYLFVIKKGKYDKVGAKNHIPRPNTFFT